MRASSIFALGLISVLTAPVLLAADFSPDQDRAWAYFIHPVKIADRLLPEGRYLFVHDDKMKVMGEPCLFLFSASNLDEPLVAIHC